MSVVARVSLEPCQLSIRCALVTDPEEREDDSDDVDRREALRVVVDLTELQRQRHDREHDGLSEEDSSPQECAVAAALVARQDPLVADVGAIFAPTPEEVAAEPQAPHGTQPEENEFAVGVPVRL